MSPPKTLTSDQCQALIVELMPGFGTDNQKTRGARNGAMAIVMLETGIRVGELCSLRIDDLWYAEQPVENLVVRKEIAKNHHERQIPISERLSGTIMMMASMLWSPKKAGPSANCFFSSDPYNPLTTRTVERIILDAGKSAFNLKVTPHMLRHTFGSRMMRKTNSRIVQSLLGHSNLESTQIYMHPNSDDLRKAIDGD